MKFNVALSVVLSAGLTLACTSAAAQSIDDLLKPCVSCHGMDGVGSTPKTPFLNWQLPSYLKEVMENMQAGVHPTAVPKHIPASITKDQIKIIADHYAANRTPREKQPFDEAKAAAGEKVYEKRCMDCHPDNARETNDRGSPILAGQPAEYILAQERLYMSGKRKFSSKSDTAHAGMTDADLEAVSHFYASQDVQAPQQKKKKRR